MRNFRRFLMLIAACVVLVPALAWTAQAQTHRTKIEVKGTATQIDPTAGTFVVESLTATTTAATRYEDLQDRTVSKESFFSNLHANDRVEVEGSLKGNVITAHKIEAKHP